MMAGRKVYKMKGKVLALCISILWTLSLCMPYLPVYVEGGIH